MNYQLTPSQLALLRGILIAEWNSNRFGRQWSFAQDDGKVLLEKGLIQRTLMNMGVEVPRSHGDMTRTTYVGRLVAIGGRPQDDAS